MPFTKANFENATIELLRDHLGYAYQYGPDVVRDYTEPQNVELLRSSLGNVNRGVYQNAKTNE